jgi:hypothetical protein
LSTLQIFLAALDAVEVVGPTDPESWAVQHVERIESAVTTAETAWKSFIVEVLREENICGREKRCSHEGQQLILKLNPRG